MNKTKLLGNTLVTGTTICYALVPSFSFLAFRAGVETETVLFGKFFYASILIWAYIFIRRLPFRLDKTTAKMMATIGISYIGLATTLYLAFDYISGSLATVISFTYPAMIVAVEMIREAEKRSIAKIIAVVTSFVGLIFIVWSPELSANLKGIFFAFCTALCYVVYTMGLGSKSIQKAHTLVVAGYVLLMSVIFNFFRCLISHNPLFTSNFTQLKLILVLAVVCAFMAILFYCIGVRMIGPSSAAIINTFEPVLACYFGYTIIGDVLTRNMIIGTVFVVAAIFIANLPDRARQEEVISTSS